MLYNFLILLWSSLLMMSDRATVLELENLEVLKSKDVTYKRCTKKDCGVDLHPQDIIFSIQHI